MSIILVKGSTRAALPCLALVLSQFLLAPERKTTLNISKQNIKQLSAKDRKLN